MSRRDAPAYISPSRVKGLGEFLKRPLSAYQLGELMWPGHKMAKVNARGVVRELLLHGLIEPTQPMGESHGGEGEDPVLYRPTDKAESVMANPPWLCRYCQLDVTETRRKLSSYWCSGCPDGHLVCRWCRKHLLRATGEFPYKILLRGCPGKVEVPKRPEPKKKNKAEEVQPELAPKG